MPRSVDHQFTICQPLPVERTTAVAFGCSLNELQVDGCRAREDPLYLVG
jgi:hypothetical protein